MVVTKPLKQWLHFAMRIMNNVIVVYVIYSPVRNYVIEVKECVSHTSHTYSTEEHQPSSNANLFYIRNRRSNE